MEDFRSKTLDCGCCGGGFSTWLGYTNQGQDRGYGICQGCQNEATEKDESQWDDIIQEVSEALNPQNSAKFAEYDRDKQKAICSKMIKDGIIQFQIGRSAA